MRKLFYALLALTGMYLATGLVTACLFFLVGYCFGQVNEFTVNELKFALEITLIWPIFWAMAIIFAAAAAAGGH